MEPQEEEEKEEGGVYKESLCAEAPPLCVFQNRDGRATQRGRERGRDREKEEAAAGG